MRSSGITFLYLQQAENPRRGKPVGGVYCTNPVRANKTARAYPKTCLMSMIEQVRWRKPWKRVLDFSQRMHSRR
jgi:hypothetical protein